MQGEGGSRTVPFTSSNPSILLYYQTTVVVVCSFIHYLAKKRIGRVNAVCSNWYKMCSQLITEGNTGKKFEITSTWPSCCHRTASSSKGE